MSQIPEGGIYGRPDSICCHGKCQNLTEGYVYDSLNISVCKICGWMEAYNDDDDE